MSNRYENMEVDTIRSRLEKLVVDRIDVDVEQAKEFSLHMTDWLQDVEDLMTIFKSIQDHDDESLFNGALKFLLHAPAHIVFAASVMTGETAEELLGLSK